MKALLLFVNILAFGLNSFALSLEEAKEIFSQANAAYTEENFEEARDLYLQLESDFSSFEYYYNLGNTYYKLDDIPSAILYYEKAHKIDPNNDDLETNLMIANQFTLDKIDVIPLSNVRGFWNRVISESNLFYWTTLSIASIIVAFALFAFYLLKRHRRSIVGLGVVILIFGFINFYLGIETVNRMNENTEAIIFTDEVEVLSQPEGTQIEFVIHRGTKVKISERKGDWTEIKIANGNVGWVRSESFKEI